MLRCAVVVVNMKINKFAMKTNYIAPLIEIIEIEIEDAVLQNSAESYSLNEISDGGSAW